MSRFLLPLLLVSLLVACAAKREAQDGIEWGEMRELFPPTVGQPDAKQSPAPVAAPAADAAAPASAAAAQPPPAAAAATAPAAAAATTPAAQAATTPAAAAAAQEDAPLEAFDDEPAQKEAAAPRESAAAPGALAAETSPSPGELPKETLAPADEPALDSTAAASEAFAEPAPAKSVAAEFEEAPPADGRAKTPQWPHVVAAKGVSFEVHAPQVDAWDGEALLAHALVKAQGGGRKQPAIGAVRMTARTEVDDRAKVVALQDVHVTAVRFPGAPDKTQTAWLETLRAGLPQQVDGVPLERVESGIAAVRARERGAAVLSVIVPRVVIAKKPTVLVYIDGEPRYVPVKGTELSGVLNTRTLLVRNGSGRHWLRLYDGWVSADSLRGPWSVAQAPPGASKIEQAARASGRANLLRGKPDPQTRRRPSLKNGALPQILVATKPTALLVLNGEPRFAPVAGTPLQYATNTSAHLFRDVESKQLYVRVAGYWLRSSSTAGPWEFVPADRLPESFAAIPDDSPKRGVKAGIAAAKQEYAAPARGIAPVMVAASPTRASLNMTLDGDPEVQPIQGTQLKYLANASVPVIQLDERRWFAIQNGAWFGAETVAGPWRLTDAVPPEIYAIPPYAPVYPAIHSRVYSSSSDVVYFAYEPSLLGISGGAVGMEDQGEDYQYTPPAGMHWGWFY
jgi:hypothetical protein